MTTTGGGPKVDKLLAQQSRQGHPLIAPALVFAVAAGLDVGCHRSPFHDAACGLGGLSTRS